jgi:hypothetical protein
MYGGVSAWQRQQYPTSSDNIHNNRDLIRSMEAAFSAPPYQRAGSYDDDEDDFGGNVAARPAFVSLS